MCDRFALHTPRSLIARRYFGIQTPIGDVAPTYNNAPETQITMIRAASPRSAERPIEFEYSWWGFRPQWVADNTAPRPINSRAERVATSRYFRTAFVKRRGLVPASGWYEWRVENGRKQPYYIRRRDGEVLMFAAVYEPTGVEPDTCCAIVTRPAQRAIAYIHDRMPAALDPSCWDDWLDPELTKREEIRQVTKPISRDLLEAYPVSTAVNNTQNRGPRLMERI